MTLLSFIQVNSVQVLLSSHSISVVKSIILLNIILKILLNTD